jgi:hypothetical protein
MSDHWWALFQVRKGGPVLEITGYGRRTWGKPLETTPTVTATKPKEPPVEYKKPVMSMWSGVKLYYGPGPSKQYVGEIVCFSGSDLVKVKYPSGNLEWKSRSAIINLNGQWYVRKDDPALKAMKYVECSP